MPAPSVQPGIVRIWRASLRSPSQSQASAWGACCSPRTQWGSSWADGRENSYPVCLVLFSRFGYFSVTQIKRLSVVRILLIPTPAGGCEVFGGWLTDEIQWTTLPTSFFQDITLWALEKIDIYFLSLKESSVYKIYYLFLDIWNVLCSICFLLVPSQSLRRPLPPKGICSCGAGCWYSHLSVFGFLFFFFTFSQSIFKNYT